jgi:hypothetical protein
MIKKIFLTLLLCTAILALYAQNKVPFAVAKRYFMRNDAQFTYDRVGDALSPRDYFVMTNKEELEKTFGYGTIMGSNGRPTKIDFNTQFAIAIVNPGKENYTSVVVKDIKQIKRTLYVSYDAFTDGNTAENSNVFEMVIVDKKYGGAIITKKTIKKITTVFPKVTSDSVYIKGSYGATYTYSKKKFGLIESYFTDVFKTEIINPDSTYRKKYWEVKYEPTPGSPIALLNDNGIYFSSRSSVSEFATLYAHFLKQINDDEKYNKIRNQLIKLYDASISLDMNMGANGTFTSEIFGSIAAYVEYDIYKKFATSNINPAQDTVGITKQKALYINKRNHEVQKFVTKKFKQGERPPYYGEQKKQAKQNLATLNSNIDNLFILKALEEFDKKFR